MVRFWFVVLLSIITSMALTTIASATTPATITIQAVQAESGLSAGDEFVILRNTTDQNIDVSNWKLVYLSASGATSRTLATFTSAAPTHLLFPAQTSEAITSTTLAQKLTFSTGLMTFTSGIASTGGTIVLKNAANQTIDQIGWGSAVTYENTVSPAMTSSKLLWRTAGDTDNNSVDFQLITIDQVSTLPFGGLYEVDDVCLNIDGIQVSAPAGLMAASDGDCTPPDLCLNIDGIQATIPEGYEQADSGNCRQIDRCDNVDGIQADISISMYVIVGNECYLPFSAADLRLTELLPNPEGVDAGREFIEIYNASSETVALNDYYLVVGTTVVLFPAGSGIGPNEYVIFSDGDLATTFTNATGKSIELFGRDDSVVSAMPAYMDAPDDQSWALIDGEWRYTNRPTAAGVNLGSLVVVGSGSGNILGPCGEGKYRSPETNRCRSYAVASVLSPCGPGQERNPATNRCRSTARLVGAALTACRSDQYRNPLTNRCKSIAAELSSLTPCKEGQYRNPETNRCRKLTTLTSSLQPCAEGQERNPETNRCRKLASMTPTQAAYPVEPVEDTAAAFTAWWALGGVVALGIGYAGWEYRHEIGRFVRRIVTRGTS